MCLMCARVCEGKMATAFSVVENRKTLVCVCECECKCEWHHTKTRQNDKFFLSEMHPLPHISSVIYQIVKKLYKP